MSKRKTYNWDALQSEFENSALSITAFAKSKGIAATTARAHLKVSSLKREKLLLKSQIATNKNEKDNDFIPLEFTNPEMNDIEIPEATFIRTSVEKADTPIELRIGNISILLHTGFEKADLRNILDVVRESC